MNLETGLAVFRTHHIELRQRTIRVFISIALFTVIAYFFSEQIAQLFIRPLFNASPEVHKMVYTYLPDAFLSYLKLALLVGIITSFPVILYQTWRFVSPGLKENERKLAYIVVFWSSLLFLGGVAFAFLGVLPRMLIYFMSYAHEGLEPLPKFGMYLTFVVRLLFGFGLSFQIPFLMIMASKAGIVQPAYFSKRRIYFYIAIVVLAFLLTAGDFMATALLAIPLFFLYEAGLFLLKLFPKKESVEE